MPEQAFDAAELAQVDELVEYYRQDLHVYELFANQLRTLAESPQLQKLYHSTRWRVKAPDHLKDKLLRKLQTSKSVGEPFGVTKENLFERITDLAGLRLLHLHTSQFAEINRVLVELLTENRYAIIEGPEARTWDLEYKSYFDSIGIKTVDSERMYTSVHYVVGGNTRTTRTAEIQVRTLAEELWGEVDHSINYPHVSDKLACREQIKVLARVTSSCTRLVDSIFAVHNE